MGCSNHLHQQDSLWSWMVLLTATLGDGLTLAMSYCYSVILPVLVEEFKETRENVAWVSSIALSLSFLAAPISAPFCSRFGSRLTAIIGAIMCSVSLISSAFATSITVMYFSFGFMLGLGYSFLHVAGILILQRYFKKRRSLATGIFACSSSFGSLLGPIFQLLIDNLKWRTTFWVLGLWFTVLIVLSLVFYSPNINDGRDNDNTISRDTAGRRRKISCSYWNSWFTIGVIVIALQSFAIYAPLTHMVKHANEVGYPEKKSSMLLVYIGVASLIGKVTAGRALDSPRICVFWMNQVGGLISSASIFILAFANDDLRFISYAILYGFGNGLFMAAQYVLWLNSVAHVHRPSGLATGEAIAGIGIMTGSPFIGFLADQAGSYVTSFMVAAAVVLAATLILFLRFCFQKKVFLHKRASILLDTANEEEIFERETVL